MERTAQAKEVQVTAQTRLKISRARKDKKRPIAGARDGWMVKVRAIQAQEKAKAMELCSQDVGFDESGKVP